MCVPCFVFLCVLSLHHHLYFGSFFSLKDNLGNYINSSDEYVS